MFSTHSAVQIANTEHTVYTVHFTLSPSFRKSVNSKLFTPLTVQPRVFSPIANSLEHVRWKTIVPRMSRVTEAARMAELATGCERLIE
jgi:hypothetical protein